MNYILSENSISFVVKSKTFSIERSDSKFHKSIGIIFDPVYSEEQKIKTLSELVDDKAYVLSLLNLCPLVGSETKYNNLSFPSIRNNIDHFINKIPDEILIKLIENISIHSNAESLLRWISNNKSLISDDGNLYLYKGLRTDYKDRYSGMIENFIGKTIEMPREDVTVFQGGPGFYFGTFERAQNMSEGPIVLCKVFLSDIVYVGCGEMKVCKYKVIKNQKSELPFGAYSFSVDDWKAPEPPPAPKTRSNPIRTVLRRFGLRRNS